MGLALSARPNFATTCAGSIVDASPVVLKAFRAGILKVMLAEGLVAGAVGTAALDMYTYADILVRGRATSELPSKVVQKLAERVRFTTFAQDDSEPANNRRSGAGALVGYGVGLGAGLAYACIRPKVSWLPWPIAASSSSR